MEANAPYALYDNDGTRPMQWAAHIRLTPELLRKLEQAPERVLLTLNTSASSSATRKSSTKTSLLSVDMGAQERERTDNNGDGDDEDDSSSSNRVARYELHSFQEDPRVNYLCALRRDPSASARGSADAAASPKDTRNGSSGYSIYTTGKIYQKLIVQRMLDSTEKGRMKDRHAQSVIESRARSSKLLDDATAPSTGASKRRRISLFSSQPVSKLSTKSAAATAESPRPRRVLRSALSAAAAQQTKEKIEKGFEKPPPTPATAAAVATASPAKSPPAPRKQRARASSQSQATEHASLFSPSSGSDASDNDAPARAETPARPASVASTASVAASSSAQTLSGAPAAGGKEPSAASGDTFKPPGASTSTTEATVSPPALAKPPTVHKPLAPPEKKRPLVRGTRIPDLAFFPEVVSAICKKVATHITRSAILDDADYSAFEQQYDSFCADWATLDKAYSIEVINMESVHIRMQFARCDDERAALEKERQEHAKKREALLFVREAMGSIKKILASLQASITRYDQKLA